MTAASVAALPPARHVLVVATQCDALADKTLNDLVDVADELHRVLVHPDLGACRDADVPHAALVRSGKADRTTVDTAVREAVVRAGEARAVLVLAFLGHGQSPPGSPQLYYMAANSRPDDPVMCLDVNGLIKDAVNHPNIAGLIVLLDTCQSGAALPSAEALVGGFRDGQTRVSVLAAAPAQEPAYDLDFSRRIVHHVREGFPEAGEFVSVARYRAALAADLPSQDPLSLEYDGVPTAVEEGLWLAKNSSRGPVAIAVGLGPIGAAQLGDALRSWPQGGADATACVEDLQDLAALRDRAGAGHDIGALRVYEVADALLLVRETELFLVMWAGQQLTSYDVRRAMTELNAGSEGFRKPLTAPPELTAGELLRHFLEDAALHDPHGGSRRPYARALARCLVAVAHACGMDAAGEEVLKWAEAHGLTVELTDAVERARRLREQASASLVISLHAALTDWPDSLTVWLRQGDKCSNAHSVACTPSREGVESALPEVLEWAEDLLPPDVRLTHIDMVVRAALLPKWRPEEAEDGLYRLGVDRSVVLRWADRLFVPRHFRSMNKRARLHLEACRKHVLDTGESPVGWLNATSSGDVAAVHEHCKAGLCPPAVGIGHRSGVFSDLLQTLLPYAPVLLWPDGESGTVVEPPAGLARLWERLPADFIRAQRLQWSADLNGQYATAPNQESAELMELAALRAAWHDLPWLDFCDSFRGRAPMSAGGTE
ncbi:hypothetical protein ACFVZN_11065 [Streptomyces virginiae]|uniref:vWA-MoxR associated conflict system protein n=1 Tax=Streptomyces virginiae TaxID=1961 RepID=UPI0036C8628D